jgi:carbon-monoxide dehydrogenase medium subunit
MIPSSFDYHAPDTLDGAARLLAQHGADAKLLAGGHSLLPLMKLRLSQPRVLIDLGRISSLSYIREQDGGLAIGAMTTYDELQSSDLVRSRAPVLAEAAGVVADPQVRNMGTIGGSLSHSDPGGDLPAVALALNASLSVTSSRGRRTVEAGDLFVELLTTSLRPDEIVSEIVIPPLPKGAGTAYVKFANKASRYAIVGVAAVVALDGETCREARVGVTGAGAKAARASATESALEGSRLDEAAIKSAAQSASDGIDLNDDVHSSAEYRGHLTRVLAERAISSAASRAG